MIGRIERIMKHHDNNNIYCYYYSVVKKIKVCMPTYVAEHALFVTLCSCPTVNLLNCNIRLWKLHYTNEEPKFVCVFIAYMHVPCIHNHALHFNFVRALVVKARIVTTAYFCHSCVGCKRLWIIF